jgi:microcystin-dependent protein
MSELITQQIFTDGQQNINAADMNGIVGQASVQPDLIANKPVSVTMDIADQFLVLKTDNTLAKSRFDTIVNSTSSTLPLCDSTRNGMLRQVSGKTTDFVDGTNNCQPVANIIPTGTVWDFLGSAAPTGWLLCQGQSVLRTDYPALFALIGTTYGSADGTHFNLPDARGRATIGAGQGTGLTNRVLGASVGAETVALATANLPAHAHPITDVAHSHTAAASDSGHTHPYNTIGAAGSTWSPGSGWTTGGQTTGVGYANVSVSVAASGTGLSTTQNVGSGTAHANMQPSLVVNKIVKV